MTVGDWRGSADTLDTFERYCAPRALSGLMECTPREAAEELMSVPDMLHQSQGCVNTGDWRAYLQRELGGVEVEVKRTYEERRAISIERYGHGHGIYADDVALFTVAQWLRANPNTTAILGVAGHTLFVKDGRVSADTKRTKSMRCRVQDAVVFPNEA